MAGYVLHLSEQENITLSAAVTRRLIDGAEAHSRAIGVPMCIAITDESGHLLAFSRMDGGKITSATIAIDKAFTAAAARKQAPIVAVNALAALDGKPPVATYNGYGSCPLTVEAGKIVHPALKDMAV